MITMKVFFLIPLSLCWFVLLHAQQSNIVDSSIVKKAFVYKTVGNLSIGADVYSAATSTKAKLKPAIIWIHGGGLIFGSRSDLPEEQLNLYTKAGFTVIAIDYRLAPETKLPGIVADVNDAIEWVYTNGTKAFSIDTSCLFLVGHSGGAYLALVAGYTAKHKPAAIVSFYGYGDIQADWYTKPDSFFLAMPLIREDEVAKMIHDTAIASAAVNSRLNLYFYTRQQGVWPQLVTGHDPAKEKEWFYSYCPLKNFQSSYPPVLLIHGDKDNDVPCEQSVLMNQVLESKKVKHRFIQLNGYGHVFDVFSGGFSNPGVKKVFDEVIDFLNTHNN